MRTVNRDRSASSRSSREPDNVLLAARKAPRRSLAALHVSLAVLTGFLVAVVLVSGSDAGKTLVDEHFGVLRFAAYGAWAIGIAAFFLAVWQMAHSEFAESKSS